VVRKQNCSSFVNLWFDGGSCGFANVLQCGWGFLFSFLGGEKQNKFIQFAPTYPRAKFPFSNQSFLHESVGRSGFLHLQPTVLSYTQAGIFTTELLTKN
jgi:hypothetical protein